MRTSQAVTCSALTPSSRAPWQVTLALRAWGLSRKATDLLPFPARCSLIAAASAVPGSSRVSQPIREWLTTDGCGHYHSTQPHEIAGHK